MNFLMLDLETLGLNEKPVICSIGAVVFNQNGIVDELHILVNLQEQQILGFQIEADAVQWWLKQSPEAQQELANNSNRQILHTAISTLFELYTKHECQGVWGNGALADIRWINAAFASYRIETPWKFYQEFCYRTMKAMFPDVKKPDFAGTKHNALDDARHQALHLIEILKQKENKVINVYQFIDKYGIDKAKITLDKMSHGFDYTNQKKEHGFTNTELCIAIIDFEIISNIGGIELAKNIIQIKNREDPKATHYATDPSKRYLQLYARDDIKLNSVTSFAALEAAIERIEMGLQA